MSELTVIANLIMGICVLAIWITAVVVIAIGFILSKVYERRFYKAVKECVAADKFDLQQGVERIRTYYAVYSNHRFGFVWKKIIPICQELSSRIMQGRGLDSVEYKSKDKWVGRLDEIIRQLQHEEHFDDEKANEIIDELSGKVDAECIGKIKQKLIYLEAYHKGVLNVKNLEISELREKNKKKQWITWISGIIGLVAGIATIIQMFT